MEPREQHELTPPPAAAASQRNVDPTLRSGLQAANSSSSTAAVAEHDTNLADEELQAALALSMGTPVPTTLYEAPESVDGAQLQLITWGDADSSAQVRILVRCVF